MEKSEYFEVKKETDLLMEELRKDALGHGVNPLSKEYREAKSKMKEKLLESGGYNPGEYFAMERTYGDGTSLVEGMREGRAKVETLAKRLMDRIRFKKNG